MTAQYRTKGPDDGEYGPWQSPIEIPPGSIVGGALELFEEVTLQHSNGTRDQWRRVK